MVVQVPHSDQARDREADRVSDGRVLEADVALLDDVEEVGLGAGLLEQRHDDLVAALSERYGRLLVGVEPRLQVVVGGVRYLGNIVQKRPHVGQVKSQNIREAHTLLPPRRPRRSFPTLQRRASPQSLGTRYRLLVVIGSRVAVRVRLHGEQRFVAAVVLRYLLHIAELLPELGCVGTQIGVFI